MNLNTLNKQLIELANKIKKYKNDIKNEEHTKTAFILPFLRILNIEVENPRQVIPEYGADIAVKTKRLEAVDYAIIKNNNPILLIECKSCTLNLKKDDILQLSHYYHTTETQFAILTNGIIYEFYSDFKKSNVMDHEPFLKINLLEEANLNCNENLEFLNLLDYKTFDSKQIYQYLNSQKAIQYIQQRIDDEVSNPSLEFIQLLTKDLNLNFNEVEYSNIIQDIFNKKFQQVKLIKNDIKIINKLNIESDHQPERFFFSQRNPIESEAFFKNKKIISLVIDDTIYPSISWRQASVFLHQYLWNKLSIEDKHELKQLFKSKIVHINQKDKYLHQEYLTQLDDTYCLWNTEKIVFWHNRIIKYLSKVDEFLNTNYLNTVYLEIK